MGDEPPRELKALSATDCVKDRLSAYFHWNDLECLEQALLIAEGQQIDLVEIERWSHTEGQASKFVLFTERLQQGKN